MNNVDGVEHYVNHDWVKDWKNKRGL